MVTSSSPSPTTRLLTILLLSAQVAGAQAARKAPGAGKTPPAASSAAPAPAAPSNEETVRARKQQGDEAMVALRYSDALDAYRAAYAITPEPALLYNMARAFQGLERFPESLDHFERFKAQASPELLAKVPQLDELVASVASHVSTLALKVDQPGARVMLRGVEIGQGPISKEMRVNAGTAHVEVLLDGYYPFQRDLTLAAGTTTPLKATLLARDRSGLLVMRSTPDGALLSVDGVSLGMTPFESPFDVGSHSVQLTKPGFKPLSSQVTLNAGERKEVDLSLSREASLLSRWWFWTGVGVVVAGGVALTYALTTEKSAGKGTLSPGQINNALVRF